MKLSTNLNVAELLSLSSLRGIGNYTLKTLAESNLTFEELIYSSPDLLGQWIKGANRNDAISGIKSLSSTEVDHFSQKLTMLEDKGVKVISFWDATYPTLYRQINNPPPLLFVRGNLNLLNTSKSVAIVGTRSNSVIAGHIAKATAQEFARRGYLIVSGLAGGIDTIAHQSTLDNRGNTAAILVDVLDIYPKGNVKLAEGIISSNGILISENYPGKAFGRAAFVSRDRLQSGLSIGVFVIESGIKGGSMHTVRFAREQSRLVFVPDYSQVKDYAFNKEQYSGVKKLFESREASTYTAKDYNSIQEKLSLKHDKLQSLIPQTSLFG